MNYGKRTHCQEIIDQQTHYNDQLKIYTLGGMGRGILIGILMDDSCCTAETNTTSFSNCSPIKIVKNIHTHTCILIIHYSFQMYILLIKINPFISNVILKMRYNKNHSKNSSS